MSATQKLVKKGVDREIAQKLTSNNLLTPRAIRKATATKLKAVTGLNTAGVNALKAKFNG